MSKKEYVLRLLVALQDTWELAIGLRLMVESSSEDSPFIDGLVDVIKRSVDGVLDANKKEKLEKSLGFLQKLQAMELDQHKKDEKEVQELEDLITSL